MTTDTLRCAAENAEMSGGRSVAIRDYGERVPDEDLLTLKQVAVELGLSNTRVMALVRRGAIDTVVRPAGPGTWRIARAAVESYVQAQSDARDAANARRRAVRLAELRAAWARLDHMTQKRVMRELPDDIAHPLRQLTEIYSGGSVTGHSEWLEALMEAYRRRTSAGVEDLAIRMPQDLFWAIVRLT